MNNFILTNKAVDDLAEIWDFTYHKWSEKQANDYYRLLIATCKRVAKNPMLGKSYTRVDENLFGFRTNNHIIFYRVINTSLIEITRILHAKMDLEKRILE